MSTVDEIQSAIESLPHKEYVRLLRWFRERDRQAWDRQLEEDTKAGKLDFLVDEAGKQKEEGRLREL